MSPAGNLWVDRPRDKMALSLIKGELARHSFAFVFCGAQRIDPESAKLVGVEPDRCLRAAVRHAIRGGPPLPHELAVV